MSNLGMKPFDFALVSGFVELGFDSGDFLLCTGEDSSPCFTTVWDYFFDFCHPPILANLRQASFQNALENEPN